MNPSQYTVLSEPLTKSACDKHKWIKGVVAVDLSEIVEGDTEAFLDTLSELLTGGPLLMDISWKVRGNEGNTLHIEVQGDASEAFDGDEGED